MINQLIRMAQSHGRLVRGRLAYGNRKVKRESGSSLPFNSRMGLRPRGSRGAVARLPSQPPPQREIGAIPPPIRRSGSSTAASRQGVFIRSRRRRRGRPPAREAGSSTQPDGRGAVWSFGREREKKSGLCKCREGERGQYVVGAWCVSGRCWPRSGSASLGVRSKVPASGQKGCSDS